MNIRLKIVILFSIPFVLSANELKIEYKDMSSFSEIPEEVREYFMNLNCLVPQIPDGYMESITAEYNSPFSGDFAQSGQRDWAVLCSVNGISSIVVRWGGTVHCKSKFASNPDEHSWEGMGDGSKWFSRSLRGHENSIIDEPYLTKGVYRKYRCKSGQWIRENLGGH